LLAVRLRIGATLRHLHACRQLNTKRRKLKSGRGQEEDRVEAGEEEDMLELDLDEEESEVLSNCMAIVVFYSRKSYNPKFLFADMLNSWSVAKLVAVEKLGDYIFKIEFIKGEEKARAIEGGSWRQRETHRSSFTMMAQSDLPRYGLNQ
jgi:hypothetical protein